MDLPVEVPEEVEGCEGCQWETRELESYNVIGQERVKWLCQVCSKSMAGNTFLYRPTHPDTPILQTICWGINYLASLIQSRP